MSTEGARVVVTGASGRMGREVVKAISQSKFQLVGAVDVRNVGADAGVLAGIGTIGIEITDDLQTLINKRQPEILVDFTVADAAVANARLALLSGVRPVVGTTGISLECIDELHSLCEGMRIGAVIAPNFAIGAVLMMKFAREAAKYFPDVEIIELHHAQKLDAPSGTAIKTAEMIRESAAFPGDRGEEQAGSVEKIAGVRGGNAGGVRIHSIRLPGLVAHQEVIFGGLGQSLTIRHDSYSRESFMPGVLLAMEKARELDHLVYGLENLL